MSSSYHFCLIDVLRQAERSPSTPIPQTDNMAYISTNGMACNGFRIDTFTIEQDNSILDANSDLGIRLFADLITQNKLFHINVELAFDELLTARHSNAGIRRSLETVFAGQPLPETTAAKASPMSEDMIGKLHHPMLAHMDVQRLAELYCRTIRELDKNKIEHDLIHSVIGQKTGVFIQQYSGLVCGNSGLIKIAHLLEKGMRVDHDPHKGKEDYIAEGEKEAKQLENSDSFELLLGWMECDNYQMRRCLELDLFLKINPFQVMPTWVELEIFSFLKYEAKKQHIARLFFQQHVDMKMQNKTPQLYDAIRQNADGMVDQNLQTILVNTISNSSEAYTGSAMEFFKAAKTRESEAYRSRMIA